MGPFPAAHRTGPGFDRGQFASLGLHLSSQSGDHFTIYSTNPTISTAAGTIAVQRNVWLCLAMGTASAAKKGGLHDWGWWTGCKHHRVCGGGGS